MYEKPRIIESEDFAEGIYLASGSAADGGDSSATSGTCWKPRQPILTQSPEPGRDTYVFDMGGHHYFTGSAHQDQHLHPHMRITFNQPVNVIRFEGQLVGGNADGVTQIELAFTNCNSNGGEDKDFGHLEVSATNKSMPVSVVSVSMTDE